MLRCDVMVDVIDSIEVLSRTREIYVEDSPLELAVRALDVKGTACEKGSPSTMPELCYEKYMLLVAFVFRREGGLILLCQLARVHEFSPLCDFDLCFQGTRSVACQEWLLSGASQRMRMWTV